MNEWISYHQEKKSEILEKRGKMAESLFQEVMAKKKSNGWELPKSGKIWISKFMKLRGSQIQLKELLQDTM